MRLFNLMLGVIMLSSISSSWAQIDQNLKRELDSIYTEDQRYRALLFSDQFKDKQDSLAALYKVDKKDLLSYLMIKMEKTDSANLARIETIISQYGYPGKSLVGPHSNEAAFFVIQHSQNIDKYLSIVENAANQQEIPFQLYAMMLDRSLMYNGKEQVYGTQGKGIQTTNRQTGEKLFKMIIWPIKDPASVNERRKKAGFKETVEENAKRLNIVYEVFTLKQIKEMEGK